MCDPMLMLGAGLSAAGGISRGMTNQANQKAQSNVEKAAYLRSKKAREEELVRQKTFEDNANTAWADTNAALSKTNYDNSQGDAVSEFMATMDANPTYNMPEGFTLDGQEGASSAVSTANAVQAVKAAQEARARVSALAKLTSYDSAALDRSLALGKNADGLTTTNNMRRGSLGVSNAEQNIAMGQVIPGDNIFADILSGTGSAISGANW